MSDLLLGVIIGGLIGLVGSLIQGYYFLKGKREENLARQQQQSTQIQHEKTRGIVNRVIERRERYLNPLSDQLAELHTSVTDLGDKFIHIIVPYVSKGGETLRPSEMLAEIEKLEEVEIKIEAAKKQEFANKLETFQSTITHMATLREEICASLVKVNDIELQKLLHKLVQKAFALHEDYLGIQINLLGTKDGHDFIYSLGLIFKLKTDVSVTIAQINKRIDLLLAGADAGNE